MPPWMAPSEVLLGGLLFWIFLLGILMLPFVNLIVWLVVFLLMDYVVHKLNLMRHELLHLWSTLFACWIAWGGALLRLMFFPLLFLGCMVYGVCSVTLLVICNSLLLHVVFMVIYCVAYCELILLSLVELTVCSCNRILQICGCMLIGEEEFLIVWANFDWLLPDVVICPTI